MIGLLNADAQHMPIADSLVHCIVTSPPYFQKREYVGGAQAREWPGGAYAPCTGAPACINVPAMRCEFGREPTVEAYIWHTLLVLRECWRVTRPDAVVWWNIADTSAGGGGYYDNAQSNKAGSKNSRSGSVKGRAVAQDGLTAGNLIGVPERVRLAAQADGWVVRGAVVWAKLATMPESVRGLRWERHKVKVRGQGGMDGIRNYLDVIERGGWTRTTHPETRQKAEYIDCPGCAKCNPNGGLVLKRGAWRHTISHEMIFQFTKSMDYWTNSEIVQNEAVIASVARLRRGRSGDAKYTYGVPGQEEHTMHRPRDNDPDREALATSNPRDVFVPDTSGGYGGDHYATFPPELVEPLILSATPLYACARCGAGWSPVVERSEAVPLPTNPNPALRASPDDTNGTGATTLHMFRTSSISGYRPSCKCGADVGTVPGVVLDPFCGTGTVGLVARRHGLRFVGQDVSGEYLVDHAMARAVGLTPQKKITELPLFAETEE